MGWVDVSLNAFCPKNKRTNLLFFEFESCMGWVDVSLNAFYPKNIRTNLLFFEFE